MEDKYKLQELHTKSIFTNKIVKRSLFIVWLVGILYLIIKFIIVIELGFKFSLLIFAFAHTSICGITALTIHFFPKNNKDYKQIKNIGQKNKAYIIDAGFSTHSNSHYKLFYITISYEGKIINIYKIKNNEAYSILKLLLDSQSYPVQKTIKIPIDIYSYKNKVYADLDSVELSKIEGFNEIKKQLNKPTFSTSVISE